MSTTRKIKRIKWEGNYPKSSREGVLLTVHLTGSVCYHNFHNSGGIRLWNAVSFTRLLCYSTEISTVTLSIETFGNAWLTHEAFCHDVALHGFIHCFGMPTHHECTFSRSVRPSFLFIWHFIKKCL